jgi:glutamate 5-kinase
VNTPQLSQFRRVVVKIGSALLVDNKEGALKRAWLESLADDLAAIAKRGAEVLVVSSGSIALGRTVLGLPGRALRLEESQAAAAVGQIALARAWAEALGKHNLTAGQILLALNDTEERERYLNARATIQRLLDFKAVPVINENDTVATTEIRYGDNDRLGARVATMTSSDLLVLLSDVDGLYTAPPARDPNAQHLPVVERVTPEIEAMAGAAGSEFSSGGMKTKIDAAKIATSGGAHMVIASGKIEHPLRAIEQGGRCTWFLASATPSAARKRWIAGGLAPRGSLYLDDGAVKALRSGKSLLPAGVTRVDGDFDNGDAVVVRDAAGMEIGRGLVGCDASEARKIMGKNSAAIEAELGMPFRGAMIHRDDLVVTG